MYEFKTSDFDALCRTAAVREWMAGFDAGRRKALGRCWLRIAAGGAGIVVALSVLAYPADWADTAIRLVVAIFLTCTLAAGTIVWADAALEDARAGLKQPVLGELARIGGMEYRADGFASPLGPGGAEGLFGHSSYTTQKYSDILYGTGDDGRGFAIFEAGFLKGDHVVFAGQIYVYERPAQPAAPATETLIRSRRGFFTYVRIPPPDHLPRIALEEGAELDRRFRIYSSDPQAERLLKQAALRRLLQEQRRRGPVDVYIGPAMTIIAVSAKDRFEVGSLLLARTARAPRPPAGPRDQWVLTGRERHHLRRIVDQKPRI